MNHWIVRARLVLLVATLVVLGAGPTEAKTKVRYSASGDSLLFGPIYLAKDLGYFDAAGIDFDSIAIAGGTQSTAALTGGSVDIIETAFSHIVKSYDAGIHLVAFAAVFEELGLDVVVSSKTLAKSQVSSQSPLAARAAALKGLRIGVTSLGSTTDTFARSLLRSAGLNPDTDASLIRMGNGPGMMSGLSQGAIDGFVFPMPFPQSAEAKGLGKVLISATRGEVPEWRGMLYIVLTTTKKYIDANPAAIQGLTHAIGRSLKFIQENPEDAKNRLRKFFPKVEPEVMDLSLVSALGAYAKTPVMSREGYETAVRFLNAGSEKKYSVPFEAVVNNAFAERVAAELGLKGK